MNDPKKLIWHMMNDIQEMIQKLNLIIDEYACDIDDGYDWVPVEVEEECQQ